MHMLQNGCKHLNTWTHTEKLTFWIYGLFLLPFCGLCPHKLAKLQLEQIRVMWFASFLIQQKLPFMNEAHL